MDGKNNFEHFRRLFFVYSVLDAEFGTKLTACRGWRRDVKAKRLRRS